MRGSLQSGHLTSQLVKQHGADIRTFNGIFRFGHVADIGSELLGG